MEKEDLIRKAGNYVFALFKEKLSKKLVYHNYKHTFEVVKEARQLSEGYHLSEEELEILLLAAWFHDTGYVSTYEGHEDESVEVATTFLREEGYAEESITQVARCIMATKHGQLTHHILEDILVDADIANIGKETFFATAELLRVEWEIFMNRTFSDLEWAQFQLDFLLSVSFRTQTAQAKYSKQLSKNIQAQRNHLLDLTKKKKKKEKQDRETLAQPKRGIETMFKSTYDNHISLSAIADNKANMMISLNSIIMSIIITYLGTKSSIIGAEFTRNPILMIPVGILLATSLASVISAIISAQPEVTSFRLRPNKLTSRRINLLFFGNFTKIPLEDFQSGMHDIMRNKNALYNNMITDIYYLGDVLSKKYRLLRISYTIFMIGIILTVLSFVIAIAQ
ncbi:MULTISPECIES: Pycsar system effector family protein [Rufibacter]|uniref:Putative metal-dependent HD superfamily phosphohydrolase n=1 Tax=Rufibacter quisquiliarum TaxID=1549639 RepID=A0A839GNF7_9BACT|nr:MULTISPECIES: Pycsar system effector family protein [Rufibacter]MBA9078349.1 putative metal-dependent HD superfamily phosphohydrolase [Rufibacter quisquiliarum]